MATVGWLISVVLVGLLAYGLIKGNTVDEKSALKYVVLVILVIWTGIVLFSMDAIFQLGLFPYIPTD